MITSRRRASSLAGLLLALVMGTPAPAVVAATESAGEDRARRAGPASVAVEGRGYGHGRGMSQYGAQGAASEHGRTHRQILRFYYPGTEIGSARGRIRVWLTADAGDDLVVEHRRGLAVRSVGDGGGWHDLDRRGATRWRVTPVAGGSRSLVEAFTGRWVEERRLRGAAELAAGGKPVTLVTPQGERRYRGALRSAGGADRITVNVVPLEQYLRGVVPLEVPASWHPEAVQAQSVAARTYAAFERADSPHQLFDVYDDTRSQVYGGVPAEHPASDRAVRATARQAVVAGGEPAFTQFSSSNGGWTVRGSFRYLPAKQDPWDPWPGNPNRRWTVRVQASEIERVYPGIGDFRRLRVTSRDGNGPWNGRVLRLRVVGADGATRVSGDSFRSAFGLRSTWFRTA